MFEEYLEGEIWQLNQKEHVYVLYIYVNMYRLKNYSFVMMAKIIMKAENSR